MTRYFCQDHPDAFVVGTSVLAIEPGRVLLERSPFFPGVGGQHTDRGTIAGVSGPPVPVRAVEVVEAGAWHTLDGASPSEGEIVEVRVDECFRALQCELHTLAHIVNAVVFRAFDGALLTGAQLGEDETLRIDFDLPGIDNDRLRALEGPINDDVAADHPVSASWMDWDEAEREPGLFRAKSATPPKGADGTVRIVQIGDLDRQACGGTHAASTALCRPVELRKIENKGRQNRRVRVALRC